MMDGGPVSTQSWVNSLLKGGLTTKEHCYLRSLSRLAQNPLEIGELGNYHQQEADHIHILEEATHVWFLLKSGERAVSPKV
jgi:hypothetical protein